MLILGLISHRITSLRPNSNPAPPNIQRRNFNHSTSTFLTVSGNCDNIEPAKRNCVSKGYSTVHQLIIKEGQGYDNTILNIVIIPANFLRSMTWTCQFQSDYTEQVNVIYSKLYYQLKIILTNIFPSCLQTFLVCKDLYLNKYTCFVPQ